MCSDESITGVPECHTDVPGRGRRWDPAASEHVGVDACEYQCVSVGGRQGPSLCVTHVKDEVCD